MVNPGICSLKGPWNSLASSSSPMDGSLWAPRFRWDLFLLLFEGWRVKDLIHCFA